MAPPTCEAILRLYSSTLRTARSFSSYNFREYFLRRARTTFREIQAKKNPERVETLYASAVQEHAVLQRSAIINRLYGGWRLVVENNNQKPITRLRDDN
ncbi:complex 1 (lyr family) [Pyrrhoderma noxium]|uniref:Complex 1 (Lyr family) n=1 Tax=Pyrrhoderma noxium TaxID=2282107 RepID=A0A286UE91_9AGAM|nr:complex 1 (lyr family) [Pyrrhoderma noxium]